MIAPTSQPPAVPKNGGGLCMQARQRLPGKFVFSGRLRLPLWGRWQPEGLTEAVLQGVFQEIHECGRPLPTSLRSATLPKGEGKRARNTHLPLCADVSVSRFLAFVLLGLQNVGDRDGAQDAVVIEPGVVGGRHEDQVDFRVLPPGTGGVCGADILQAGQARGVSRPDYE